MNRSLGIILILNVSIWAFGAGVRFVENEGGVFGWVGVIASLYTGGAVISSLIRDRVA